MTMYDKTLEALVYGKALEWIKRHAKEQREGKCYDVIQFLQKMLFDLEDEYFKHYQTFPLWTNV